MYHLSACLSDCVLSVGIFSVPNAVVTHCTNLYTNQINM